MTRKRVILVSALLFLGYYVGWYLYQSSRFQRLEFSAFIEVMETSPQSFKQGTFQTRSMSEGRTGIQGQWKDGQPFITNGVLDERIREKIVRSGLLEN